MTGILINDTHARPGSAGWSSDPTWRDIDLAVITVLGDIDAANTHRFLDYALGKVLLCRRMILDLSHVGFFATDGYWMLKTLESRCGMADIEFNVVPGPRVERTLQICRQADQPVP